MTTNQPLRRLTNSSVQQDPTSASHLMTSTTASTHPGRPSPGTVGHDRLQVPRGGPAGTLGEPVGTQAADLFQLDVA